MARTTLEDLQALALDKGRAAPRRRRRRARWVWPGLLVVLIAVIAVISVPRLMRPVAPTAKALRVSATAKFEITTANGYVIPRRRASVASKTQGRLVRVLVEEGDLVTEGQLLAEVEHEEEDAEVQEAEATLQNAEDLLKSHDAMLAESTAALATANATLEERKAGLTQAEAVLIERDATLQRTEALVREQIANQSQLDSVRMQKAVADAQVTQAKTAVATAAQSVHQAEASVATTDAQRAAHGSMIAAHAATLRRARATRENAFIKAPFAGMVLRREAEPGEVVSPANTGASGSKTAVVSMADFGTLEAEVDVYERDIARITPAVQCRIVLDAYPDLLLAGQVRLVRPTADRAKATVKVNVTFAKVPEIARPEMGARVTFLSAGGEPLAEDHVEVPSEAVVTRDGVQGVIVREGETELTERFVAVTIGASKDGRTIVHKGLAGGETLVLPLPR